MIASPEHLRANADARLTSLHRSNRRRQLAALLILILTAATVVAATLHFTKWQIL